MSDLKDRPLWSDDKTYEDVERLADEDSHNVIYNLHEDVLCLKEDLNNRSQWISVEKFQEVPNEGLCWIVHKGRVKHAYHDHKSMFRFSPWSDNVYMAESITAVQPILTPEPPTQEQGE